MGLSDSDTRLGCSRMLTSSPCLLSRGTEGKTEDLKEDEKDRNQASVSRCVLKSFPLATVMSVLYEMSEKGAGTLKTQQ